MQSVELVSIIIPVFNVEQYLSEALDSVLNQSYENIEVIIVDDGSTDNSGAICDGYAQRDERIKIVHQKNMGLSVARNVGLNIAQGDAVAFLDSDDALHCDYIKSMVTVMNQEETDIVICKYRIFHKTGNKDHISDLSEPSIPEGIYTRVRALRELADESINTAIWNKLYKKDLWKRIRFPEGHVYEDIDTTFRLIDQSRKVYVVDRPLYKYRKHPGTITRTNTLDNQMDRFLAYAHYEAYVRNNVPKIFDYEQLNRIRQIMIEEMTKCYVRFCGKKESKETIEKLRKMIIQLGKSTKKTDIAMDIKSAFYLIKLFPWTLKMLYPIWHLIRENILG